jgi:hypothetical protein
MKLPNIEKLKIDKKSKSYKKIRKLYKKILKDKNIMREFRSDKDE